MTRPTDKGREYQRRWYSKNREKAIEKAHAWKALHPGRTAELNWRRRGIELTWPEYLALFTKQKGLCAICKEPSPGRNFDVDHDHDTGEVRGLLCRRCNVGLSAIEHTPAIEFEKYLGKRN